MGADAIEAPMIRIVPPEDYGAARRGLRARAATSTGSSSRAPTPSTRSWSGCWPGPTDLRALDGVKLCGVGPATAERLAALRPEGRSDAAGVPRGGGAARAVGERRRPGQKILLPHADIGRELLADELRKQGADVTEVVAYRTVAVEAEREGEPDIYRMLLERRIDVVTFTSASAVRNFVRVARRRAGGRSAGDDASSPASAR